MRQVTDHAEQAVVNLWFHHFNIGADCAPQHRYFPKGAPVGFPGRRQDTAVAHEKVMAGRLSAPLLAAGDRVPGDEMNLSGKNSLHAADDLIFNAADVADDATRFEPG